MVRLFEVDLQHREVLAGVAEQLLHEVRADRSFCVEGKVLEADADKVKVVIVGRANVTVRIERRISEI